MKLLSPAQAAKLAGTTLTTLHKWIKEEKLSVMRLRGRLFIKEEWVEEFMLTPENALTQEDLEDLGADPEHIEMVMACQDRERQALANGATKLSEIPPAPKKVSGASDDSDNQGIFKKRGTLG